MNIFTAVLMIAQFCADGNQITSEHGCPNNDLVIAELSLLTGDDTGIHSLLEYKRNGKLIWSIPVDDKIDAKTLSMFAKAIDQPFSNKE